MKRIQPVVGGLLLCLGAVLSSASSGHAVGGAVRAVAAVSIVALHLVELSHALSVLEGPGSVVVVCEVPAGGQVRVLGYSPDGRWAKVQTQVNTVGWVPVQQLPPEAQRR